MDSARRDRRGARLRQYGRRILSGLRAHQAIPPCSLSRPRLASQGWLSAPLPCFQVPSASFCSNSLRFSRCDSRQARRAARARSLDAPKASPVSTSRIVASQSAISFRNHLMSL
jgi:hypothetical protein